MKRRPKVIIKRNITDEQYSRLEEIMRTCKVNTYAGAVNVLIERGKL